MVCPRSWPHRAERAFRSSREWWTTSGGRLMITWLLRIVIGLVVLVAILLIVGYSLPQNHTASRTAHFSQPPERVWAAMTDFAAFPSWRKDVQTVEVLP